MTTIIISKEAVTRMTNLTVNKTTARRLRANLWQRLMDRFDALEWDIEGLEMALRRYPEDGFVERLLEESLAERAALEHRLGLDKEMEPDWDSVEQVEIDGVIQYIKK